MLARARATASVNGIPVIRIVNGLPESDAADVCLFRLNNKFDLKFELRERIRLHSRIPTVQFMNEIRSKGAIRLIKIEAFEIQTINL